MPHTPGPWKAQQYTDKRWSILHSVKADSALVLADLVHTGASVDIKSEHANAHLLAAAPELLKALKALMVVVEDKADHVNCAKEKTTGKGLWNYALYVLDKAEGKP